MQSNSKGLDSSWCAMGFESKLAIGKTGESAIARYLRGRGFSCLPVYEKTDNEFKGPQVYTPHEAFVAPDMLVFRKDSAFWIEAKHKSAFSWHRISRRWVTGIDYCHYSDYLQVEDASPWPVWLFFLHRGGQAKDSPANSPSGLYANKLSYLRQNVNHTHENWGRSGMVYWAINHLKLVAQASEIPL